VAVIGSVFLSLYARHIDTTAFAQLPAGAHRAGRSSVAAATQTITQAPRHCSTTCSPASTTPS